MAYSQHLLSWECRLDIGDEFASPGKKVFQCLDIIGPYFALQTGDKATCKTAPVTLTEQRGSQHFQLVGLGNDAGGIHRTLQVAGQHDIDLAVFPRLTQLTGLTEAILIQFALRLSLHDLIGIIHRFTMPHQV